MTIANSLPKRIIFEVEIELPSKENGSVVDEGGYCEERLTGRVGRDVSDASARARRQDHG